MKPAIRNIFIILLFILLWKLYFIPPKNLYFPSENIRESKRVKAFVGEYNILRIDTLVPGYEFPFEKIWVERLWSLGRNRLGMVIPVTEKSKVIIFDLSPNKPFFTKYNYLEEWIVKDSLTRRLGNSYETIDINFHYNLGDTSIFKIYKYDRETSNLWRDETMEPIFKITAVCE